MKTLKSPLFEVAKVAPATMAVAAIIVSVLSRRILPMALKSRAASIACASSNATIPPERNARMIRMCRSLTGPQRNLVPGRSC